MDSKSTTTADFLDKIRDVTESLKEEFNLTNNPSENDYINTGPPPNMKRRKLIFDSMRTIIERDAGSSGGSGGGMSGGMSSNQDGNDGKESGRYVYVFGAGYHGQLGRKAARGHKKYANIPIGVHLPTSIAIREISCGALHTGVVTDGGLVYTWGDGRMGQLGHLQEGFSNQPVPTLVSTLSGVTVSHISCGQNHTICITNNGKCYSWGWAKYGQLGLGTRTNQRYPVMISDESIANKRIKQVSCGDRHSVAITTSGEIFTFGCGEHGQLGHGQPIDQYVPKQIESLQYIKIASSSCGSIHTAVVSESGKLYIFGFGENLYGKQEGNFHHEPILIPFRNLIKQVSCGQSHVLVLCINGDVYAFGDGSYGEIGQGAFKASQQPRLILLNKNISSIACGRYHSAALTNNGSLYTWGCGDNGQLGRQQNTNNDNTMINIKKANSIPKLVISLLGNVIGEISCGEHHTCVLASCRYKNLSDDVFEYGKLEEIEFQSKLNLISSSKQKGRGISKKDLIKIKKWRKEEQQRIIKKKQYNQISENKKIQQEINKISTRKDIILSSPQKLLLSQNFDDDESKQNELETTKTNKSSPLQQKETTNTITRKKNIILNDNKSQIIDQDIDDIFIPSQQQLMDDIERERVSAKLANQNRASFHETTRNFLYGMASQIFGQQTQNNQKKEKNKICSDLIIKNKFSARKEYDKLKLIGKLKELELRKLDEDLAILQEVNDCSEIASQNAKIAETKLKMKLDTVTIKISEAERSRRTYELNIVHIKDESQENHKQLDSLRRNLFLQENLKKKISKFRDYALKQKEFAVIGLKEFNGELQEWRAFLDYQYRHLSSMVKQQPNNENKENNTNNNNNNNKYNIKNNEKKAKKQQKAINRINKLKKLVENNDKEIEKLNEKLQGFEQEISFFEERFRRIYEATGLSDTDKIINKFFVNEEIANEQNNLLQQLYETLKLKEKEAITYENKLKLLHNNNNDHTWREIDILQEELSKQENDLISEKHKQEKIDLQFTLLKEWINVIINNLLKYLKNYEINDKLKEIETKYKSSLSSETSPNDLIQILFQYIKIMKTIVNDKETKTFAIKQKQQQQNNKINENLNLNNNIEPLQINNNNKSKVPKKKTRKSKYTK